MTTLLIPEDYSPILNIRQTEKAIKLIKDFFQQQLSTELKLFRITAPLFVQKNTGINDDLNGIEKPVSFNAKGAKNLEVEIVQSLAKWKRLALAEHKISHGFGIYTDMNAIRPDEVLDNLHSIYVDQWDWERVINSEERTIDFLKQIVTKIYSILKRLEFFVYEHYHQIHPVLPEEITFIHAEEAQELYPNLTPVERETALAKKYGAIFIIGIGGKLKDGYSHDGRAPDYDDWTTQTIKDYKGLNGDIVLWNPVLKDRLEISSMGIRVNEEALLNQLSLTNTENRKDLYFHKRLLAGELPLSIGGGIGQSRICMHFLRKAHIGEVQSSVWPQEMIDLCKEKEVFLF